MIEITNAPEGQLYVAIDGRRVAIFTNCTTKPVNWMRNQTPQLTLDVACAVMQHLTDNVPENLPPGRQPTPKGRWVWYDEAPDIGLAPLDESTAQDTESPVATEVETDG